MTPPSDLPFDRGRHKVPLLEAECTMQQTRSRQEVQLDPPEAHRPHPSAGRQE
eukprot:CAMPEP_0115149208 /NCGR_PEP_ID=MMETSP0227-20121206/64312_1 /TAXON_ID=89957 /ORGANISM="Polarella glacialis, Strain CCMP 1383" /LENGTH=52 /DNA_ID=CAMNT_0002559349 /DNA_START=129 /DNA_END=287 /DNA_ORIENTATION=+